MRTFFSVVLSAVGVLLLVVGGAVAVVAGPDDTAALPADDVPATSGVAVTAFDMVPVRDLTLHVTATSAAGPVFVGAAHPVDADDYLAGVAGSWVQGVDRSGALTSQAVEGELQAPEVDPTVATFWSASASGEGARSLDVRMGAEPVSFVVVPVGGPAATTLAFGIVVPGAFAAALGTAAAGVLLVVLAVVLRRRGRRPVTAQADAPLATTPGQEPVPAAAPRGGAERRAVALGAGVTVLLTACTPLPSAVEYPDEPRRLAARADEIGTALDSYAERETAANQLSGNLDPSGWAASEADALLALREYRTKLAAARGDAPVAESATWTYTALDAAVPEFGAYPMWFVALVEQTTDGEAGELPQLRVLERDRAAAPWRATFALEVPADAVDLPDPGAASTATAQQVAAGHAALELVRAHLETGGDTGVELGDLQTFREDVLGDDAGGMLTVHTSEVRLFDGPEDPTAAGGPVQVVPVDGGVLVTAGLTYRFNRRVAEGYSMTIQDPAIAEVTEQTGPRQSVRTFGLVQTVLLVPEEGAPRVVAAGWSLLAPRA